MASSALAFKDFTSKAMDFDYGSESSIIYSLALYFLTGLDASFSFYLFFEFLDDSDLSNYLDLYLYFIKGDTHYYILLPSSFSSTGTSIVF